jgi:hypothetical protein
MKGYDSSDEGLLKYYNDFITWNKEIYQEHLEQYTYLSYSNEQAVIRYFSKYCKFDLNNNETINDIEASYFEDCCNGDLEYCKPGIHNSYGYDMNSYYPRILCEHDLKIPLKAGREVKLDSIDKNNLKFGIYRVTIECYHEDFIKLFKFSASNTYTHYSLQTAFKHQETYGIKIELDMSKPFNAYLYDDSDLMETKKIFGDWFNVLMPLKNKYPKICNL